MSIGYRAQFFLKQNCIGLFEGVNLSFRSKIYVRYLKSGSKKPCFDTMKINFFLFQVFLCFFFFKFGNFEGVGSKVRCGILNLRPPTKNLVSCLISYSKSVLQEFFRTLWNFSKLIWTITKIVENVFVTHYDSSRLIDHSSSRHDHKFLELLQLQKTRTTLKDFLKLNKTLQYSFKIFTDLCKTFQGPSFRSAVQNTFKTFDDSSGLGQVWSNSFYICLKQVEDVI